MPRPKKSVPAYAYHVGGQARVYLDGRYDYLGDYDSLASRARYLELLNTLEASGRKMPEDVSTLQMDEVITVALVTREYRAETHSYRAAANNAEFRTCAASRRHTLGSKWMKACRAGQRMVQRSLMGLST